MERLYLSQFKKIILNLWQADKDSEGLMILSTDGDWLNQIFNPKSKLKKIYCKINKPLQSLSKFRKNNI